MAINTTKKRNMARNERLTMKIRCRQRKKNWNENQSTLPFVVKHASKTRRRFEKRLPNEIKWNLLRDRRKLHKHQCHINDFANTITETTATMSMLDFISRVSLTLFFVVFYWNFTRYTFRFAGTLGFVLCYRIYGFHFTYARFDLLFLSSLTQKRARALSVSKNLPLNGKCSNQMPNM